VDFLGNAGVFAVVPRPIAQKVIFLSFFGLTLICERDRSHIRTMSPLSQSSRIRQHIAQLVQQRESAERVLLGRRDLLKGTVTEVQRMCGKSGCRCTKGDKHICYQLSQSVEGRTRTRNVPRKQLETVRRLTADYRRFRQARAAWVRLNAEIIELINQLESIRTIKSIPDEPRRKKG
jgi:hypothetical protein